MSGFQSTACGLHAALHASLKIFSSPFDVDCEEIPLQLQMGLIDRQCSGDLKSKFLTCHILDFNKNHVLSSGCFLNLITHIQKVVRMFGTR